MSRRGNLSPTVCLIQDCWKTSGGCCSECTSQNCEKRCANTPDKCGCAGVREKYLINWMAVYAAQRKEGELENVR